HPPGRGVPGRTIGGEAGVGGRPFPRRTPAAKRAGCRSHSRGTVTLLNDIRYYALVPKNWLQLTLHNSWGILNVLDIIWLRPMRGGLIDESHPFCTGTDPATGKSIWHGNVIFRTPRR